MKQAVLTWFALISVGAAGGYSIYKFGYSHGYAEAKTSVLVAEEIKTQGHEELCEALIKDAQPVLEERRKLIEQVTLLEEELKTTRASIAFLRESTNLEECGKQ